MEGRTIKNVFLNKRMVSISRYRFCSTLQQNEELTFHSIYRSLVLGNCKHAHPPAQPVLPTPCTTSTRQRERNLDMKHLQKARTAVWMFSLAEDEVVCKPALVHMQWSLSHCLTGTPSILETYRSVRSTDDRILDYGQRLYPFFKDASEFIETFDGV